MPIEFPEGFIYVKQDCFWEMGSSIYWLLVDLVISMSEVEVVI